MVFGPAKHQGYQRERREVLITVLRAGRAL